MRVLLLAIFAAALTQLVSAQNTYPWPSSGSIGIGTTSPAYPLHVNGNTKLGHVVIAAAHIAFAYQPTGDGVINFGHGGNGKLHFRHTPIGGDITSWVDLMVLDKNGNLGIGTTDPGIYKLAVNGALRAKSVKVETGWADYVFDESYQLMPLPRLRWYISTYGHLPNVPTAEEIEANGNDLGSNQVLLLEKIEELTLYILQLEERISQLESANDE